MTSRNGDDHDMTLELGLISSAWHESPIGIDEGIRLAKRIGFDSYDVFEDPLVIDDATRHLIRDTCQEVGLPIRSAVCIAIGLVDFNPPVRRFTVDRCKAYLDQQAFFGGRNVLLVIGEYYWDLEVLSAERIWNIAVENVREIGEHAVQLGLEVVIELEPFKHSLVGNVHDLARFVRDVDHPAVKANADISHLHLSGASYEDVAVLNGLVGHVHLSDCNGEVHGDLPPGRGVTPIKEYLAAVLATGFSGAVSVELEYSPQPELAVEWVTEAYRETARIMAELGVRKHTEVETSP
jgi:D-psicose/D-tagatose/L-ribulose 3-epimerase